MGLIRSDLLTDIVSKAMPKEKDVQILIVCKDKEQVFPASAAVARAFPRYNKKKLNQKSATEPRTIFVDFVLPAGSASVDYAAMQRCADAVRLCAYFVDMPTSELYTDSYVEQIKAIAAKLKSVTVTVIRGTELAEKGFGGLWGVGKVSYFDLGCCFTLVHA